MEVVIRWWPALYLAIMIVAPINLHDVWELDADGYYVNLFPLAGAACVALILYPTSRWVRIIAGSLVSGVCVARALAIFTGVVPIAWLPGCLWLAFGLSFTVSAHLSWMTLELRRR